MARIDPRVLTELQKRMHIDNPWWADGKIPVCFVLPHHRRRWDVWQHGRNSHYRPVADSQWWYLLCQLAKGREKGEVDIVWTNNVSLKTERVTEIKWSNRFFENPRNLKSLKYFLELNREIKDIVVTTKDELGNAEIEGRNVSFIPSSLYAYHISYNNIYGQM